MEVDVLVLEILNRAGQLRAGSVVADDDAEEMARVVKVAGGVDRV